MADLQSSGDLSNDSIRLQLNQVETRNSSILQTPNTSFAQTMQRGLSNTANVVGNAASSAGYVIPGAAVVGAAITGVGSVRDSSAGTSTSLAVGGVGTTSLAGTGTTVGGATIGGVSGSSSSGYLGGVANQAASGNPQAQMLMATNQMQEMNQTFNLQYLQLQENMQAENREFTAISNVIKTKSDTAKNSLSNLK